MAISNIAGRFCYLAISAIVKRMREIGKTIRYHLYLAKEEVHEYQNVFQEIGNDYAGKNTIYSLKTFNCSC